MSVLNAFQYKQCLYNLTLLKSNEQFRDQIVYFTDQNKKIQKSCK